MVRGLIATVILFSILSFSATYLRGMEVDDLMTPTYEAISSASSTIGDESTNDVLSLLRPNRPWNNRSTAFEKRTELLTQEVSELSGEVPVLWKVDLQLCKDKKKNKKWLHDRSDFSASNPLNLYWRSDDVPSYGVLRKGEIVELTLPVPKGLGDPVFACSTDQFDFLIIPHTISVHVCCYTKNLEDLVWKTHINDGVSSQIGSMTGVQFPLRIDITHDKQGRIWMWMERQFEHSFAAINTRNGEIEKWWTSAGFCSE